VRLRLFIIILPVLWWGFDARAQAPEEQPSSMPEQWQLTLDVIKSRAQTLMVENNGLQVEYQQLIGQVQQLQRSVYEQQAKNEQIGRYIKERHGRTDQQERIEELTQVIKTKRAQARAFDEQLKNLTKKQSGIDRNIQQLKYTISEIELHQQAPPQAGQGQKTEAQPSQNTAQPRADDQLVQLRKQLEDQSKQEVLLENEAGAGRYGELKKRKEELEADISAYELRMDGLKQSSLTALSWPLKKKKMVHEMVLIDARNNQMRSKIKVLREDIDVLRDQVARLERRVDFVKDQSIK